MDRKTAELLMTELLAVGSQLDLVTKITDQIAGDDERVGFRKQIGELMGDVYVNLMVPIIKQYPDLDPDR